MFDLLATYRDREGDANVPHSHKEDGENIGTWLGYQRSLYKDGTLQADKRDKLETLGVLWDLGSSKQQKQWESMLASLVEYRNQEGDCFVPHRHLVVPGNKNLGNWLNRQRLLMARGDLKLSRQEKLEEVGVVWDVQSEKWEDMYRCLVEYQKREAHTLVPNSYQDQDGKNLGTWLNTQRQSKKKGLLDQQLQERLEALGVTWEVSSPRWESMFSLLVDYQKKKTGDCNVPGDFKVVVLVPGKNEKGKKVSLGAWVSRQRRYKKNGSLDAYRLGKLKEIGFSWDRSPDQWDDMLSHLSDYKEREGHCDVPDSYRTSDSTGSKKLGIWLGTQRQANRKGSLDPTRKKRLEDLGVEWHPFSRAWDEMFDLLVQYQKREGNCRVPQNHKEKGKNLGRWLRYNRLRQRNGNLGADQCYALEDLGAEWDVVMELKWDEMAAVLVQYKERNGHCRVPQTHKENGKNLGTWLRTQRLKEQAGTMDDSKVEQLEKIGIVWDVSRHKWDDMFALLVEYKGREGDCMVPLKHKECGKNLGNWLDYQRRFKRKGSLDVSKKDQLEAFGVVWDVNAFNKEEMVARLLRYKEREGDCNIHKSHREDGKALGLWLAAQRQLRATGKLDPTLSKRLEAAGVMWKINDQKWETMFALLVQYKEREGQCRVPQRHQEGEDNKNLGAWLDQQRNKKKNGKLDAALEARLEKIGVEWNIYAKFDEDDGDWGFEGMDHLFDDEKMFG